MRYNIYLVRHGQTILNRYGRMQGWCDSPLTTKGRTDAHSTGDNLAHINFNYAFSSDTKRARETCKIIVAENKATQDDLNPHSLHYFREQKYGYFEGCDSKQAWLMIGASHNCKSFKEIIKNYSIEQARDFAKSADPFHEAENNLEFWNRLNQGFNYLDEVAENNDNILLVSHGTTIRSIVHHFDSNIDISVSPSNGSVTKLVCSSGKIEVAYFNRYGKRKY